MGLLLVNDGTDHQTAANHTASTWPTQSQFAPSPQTTKQRGSAGLTGKPLSQASFRRSDGQKAGNRRRNGLL